MRLNQQRWLVVAALFTITFGVSNPFAAFGVFLPVLAEEFGWNRGARLAMRRSPGPVADGFHVRPHRLLRAAVRDSARRDPDQLYGLFRIAFTGRRARGPS